MQKKLKVIQVPDGLISNQFSNGVNVSPKTTYLYVWLKILLTDYKTNILSIQPIKLREAIGWKTNVMLKSHLKSLKDMNYISYQDSFDTDGFLANQPIEIHITPIKSNFKELYEKSIVEKLLKVSDEPEKTIRFSYLVKCYTNKEYGYCWLTYEQFNKWGNIRQQDINSISQKLCKEKLLYVTRGNFIKDNSISPKRENNKYQLLIR